MTTDRQLGRMDNHDKQTLIDRQTVKAVADGQLRKRTLIDTDRQ